MEAKQLESKEPNTVSAIESISDEIVEITDKSNAKGGLKYEVVLDTEQLKGICKTPTSIKNKIRSPVRPLSAEILKSKIDAANERRRSLEAEKLSAIREKLQKIEAIATKREDEKAALKENWEQKLECSLEKRESLIEDMKKKLNTYNTNHLQEVRQNRISNMNETEEKLLRDITTKLEVAEKNRERVLSDKLESLKKHDEKVELARSKRGSGMIGDSDADQILKDATTNTNASPVSSN